MKRKCANRVDPALIQLNSLRVEPPEIAQEPVGEYRSPTEPSLGQKLKKFLGPVGVAIVVLFAKLKFLLLPILKFLPVILKTGGTMLLSIWVYGMTWGWRFAFGFVLLIFVHECGHLLVAKALKLKVGAPVFIPFMGAFIALKEAPPNAWVEARVGIGGPILGAVGSAVCYGIYLVTDNPMFAGLAHVGFLLNLFNLAPVGFLDGGRIVTALSPWLWIVGFVMMVIYAVSQITRGHLSLVMIYILIFSVPRLISLFRTKTDAEKRYFEVTPSQRWTIAALYFSLIIELALGMEMSYIPPGSLGR